ncbi:hypothetical protein DFS34DRAFT_151759 [Phlyctochytrium arcticum]|nr:hypothetical protein DFS34DRAFT_151759 [Phlyctochytrium arcticum]
MLTAVPTPTPITEPSLQELEKPFTSCRPPALSPPLPPPRVNLDARSHSHISALIHQALQEVYVNSTIWETVILDVALEVAQDIPYALEVMGSPPSPELHHLVHIVSAHEGLPQESRYLPGPTDAQITSGMDERMMELGGTVILKGPEKEVARVEKVLELVIFVVCHLKLEMFLFADHFVTRGADDEAVTKALPGRSTDIVAPSPSRNVSKALWRWIRREGHNSGANGSLRSRSPSPEPQIDSSTRFDRAIRQIEKTIISASPDVVFPPPHLLLRLRDEELGVLHLPGSCGNTELDGRRCSYGPDDMEFPAGGSAAGASGSNSRFGSWGIASNPRGSTSAASFKSTSSRTSHISVDSKAGLGYLMTNNNSISGVIRHQTLTFAYSYYASKSNLSCRPPEILTIEYYQKSGDHYQDRTLGQFVSLLCAKARGVCPDTMCGKPMGEHVITYTHSHGRISVSVQTVTAAMEDSALSREPGQIYMYTACRSCCATTPLIPMSSGTWHVSFAKYLELLYYHPRFVPNSSVLSCSHAREAKRDGMRRLFWLDGQMVVFEYDGIDLFEMRVPRVQVHPGYYLNELLEQTRLADDIQGDGDEEMEAYGFQAGTVRDTTLAEIKSFYVSVREYIEGLAFATGSFCSAESLANSKVASGEECQTMLDALLGRYEEEEAALIQELIYERLSRINNIRLALVANITATVKELDEWKATHASDVAVCPEWCLPEYFSLQATAATLGKYGHIYPNTFVIIREMEPSSIIAFALSSKEYLQHLRRQSPQIALASDTASPETAGPPQWSDVGGGCQVKVKVFSHDPAVTSSGQHIKHKLRRGKHKFSCTVFYARDFDALRRKCGMSGNYVRSLMRCRGWDASGGKSKAGFFKTHDDQLVMKQLASKWSNQEKSALMRFAPAYFEYVNNSDKNPTILVKIFGFYTIKYKNAETGQIMRLDVLIMEHLFAGVKISRRFDLKGVPDRHTVSQKNKDNDVMWDGDWVDGRYKQLLRLHAHSKKIILESVWNDTQFLCDANVMDYSLLVGVNDEKKELVVGIVDFIGPYTWYKILETRAKTTLNAALGAALRGGTGGKDVTVLPPEQYRDRFRKAKWIKVPAMEGHGSATRRLPSVL